MTDEWKEMPQMEMEVSITGLDVVSEAFGDIAEAVEDIADESQEEDIEEKLYDLAGSAYELEEAFGDE